jgi:ADP-dependent NAD(P)H-hydrate dehydratase / NAD(P)H-hydrate epimerase
VLSAHPVAVVRAAEAELMARLPSGALMQRAAAGLAVACAQRLGSVYGRRVALLVGSGDNGGDALYAGARLARRGAQVTAVLTGSAREDALADLRAAGGRVVDVAAADRVLGAADLVVDGLLGIGGKGALREPAAGLAGLAAGRDVVAVDLPSGVDADTGEVAGPAVRAGLTVTFGTLKPGLLVGAGRRHAGRVHLVDIGLGPHLPAAEVEQLVDADVAALLPVADPGSDKYTRGVVGVAAGSQAYTGAAVLAAGAAVRAGAGMVRYVGAARAAEHVRSRWPEVVVTAAEGADVVDAGRVQAWVVGPGLGLDDRAAATVEAVLAEDVPVLVDADGLTVLARHPQWLADRQAPTLLTPHDREYARFGSDVGADRIAAARRLAGELGATVLLKGDATVVAEPGGQVRVNGTGTPALATAGTGDVLSGACGALLAGGLSALDAGSAGAHLHGRAGVLAAAGAPTSASAVLEAWPFAVRSVRVAARPPVGTPRLQDPSGGG